MKTVLYGLGVEGKSYFEICISKNVEIAYICDKKAYEIKEYKGKKVFLPQILTEEKEKVIVIIATNKYYIEIEKELNNYRNLVLVSMDAHLNLIHRCNCDCQYEQELDVQSHFFEELDNFSQYSKIALFADNKILMPDTNAGNRASLNYLNNILDKKYKIIFYPKDMSYKETYIDKLSSDKVFVLWGRERKAKIKEWLQSNASRISLNFINRPDLASDLEEYLKVTKSKIIYFGHDLHHIRLKREYNITNNDNTLEKANHIKEIEEKIILRSDLAGYPSYEEIDYVKRWIPNSNVTYFPLYTFNQHPFYSYYPSERRGMLFVGGFAHQPNVDAVLWFCKHVLPNVRKAGIEDPLFIIGSNPPLDICNMNSDNIRVLGYVSDEELKEYYLRSRITIIPLRYGAGMKGKVLEAMDYGTPVVSTFVGTEGLRNFENCLVSVDEKQYGEVLIEIYNNFSYLKLLSKNSQKYIQDHFGKNAIHEILDPYI